MYVFAVTARLRWPTETHVYTVENASVAEPDRAEISRPGQRNHNKKRCYEPTHLSIVPRSHRARNPLLSSRVGCGPLVPGMS